MARCSDDHCQGWRPDFLVTRRRAGYRLDRQWFCSGRCFEKATRERLAEPPRDPPWPGRGPRIGDLLLSQRAISAAALRLALDEQVVTNLPLGRQLETMGLVSADDVLRALSTQAGVGYLRAVDTTQLHERSLPLSSSTLRELHLVPVEVWPTSHRLKVALPAPVPWPAVRAISQVTGWTVEPLIVSDRDWRSLTEATARRDQSPAIPVASVDDVVSQTVDLARDRASRTIHIARVDPYILVRVEGRHRSDDALFHLDVTSQEEPCPAAFM